MNQPINTWGVAFYLILVTGIPILMYFLCEKIKLMNFLGVTFCCFVAGILVGNIYPRIWIKKELVNDVNNILVPVGIILLLLNSDFRKWIKLSLRTLLAFFMGVVGVIIMSVLLFLCFGTTREIAYISGMESATCIGGTANMAAIKIAFNIDNNLYNQIFLCDILAGCAYLLFMFTIASKCIGRVLKKYSPTNDGNDHVELELRNLSEPFKTVLLKIITGLLIAFVVFMVTIGIGITVYGSMENLDMAFVILGITILSVSLSFITPIRRNKWNGKTGDFMFSLFFCLLGTTVYFDDLINLEPRYIIFVLMMLIGSMLIHIILCKIFKIDRDTMIITSAAGIMSPPFIPSIAKAIKNNDLLAPGIAVGILGLAIANILGVVIVRLLINWI